MPVAAVEPRREGPLALRLLLDCRRRYFRPRSSALRRRGAGA